MSPKPLMNDIWRAGDTHQGFAAGLVWRALWLFVTLHTWLGGLSSRSRPTRRLDRRFEGRSRPPKPEWRIAPPVERRADEPFPAYRPRTPRGGGEGRA
jgi:hypothetical protein